MTKTVRPCLFYSLSTLSDISIELQTNSAQAMKIELTLGVYYFIQEEKHVAYIPSLNIIACGNNRESAESEIEGMLYEHVVTCIELGTIEEDMKNHGCKIKDGIIKEPSIAYLIRTNKTFREILSQDHFEKTTIRRRITV